LPTIKDNLRASQQELQKIRENAMEIREAFLEERAHLLASEGNQEAADIVQRIKLKEKMKNTYRRLKQVMGKTHSGPMDHVLAVLHDGTTIRIDTAEEMNRALVERNIKHFSQADGTPFTREELQTILGRYATSIDSERILRGIYDIDSIDTTDATKCILKSLKKEKETEDISDEISAMDLIKGYLKWGEGTSTSPSGVHLGHDKAILQRRKTQDEEATKQNKLPLYLRIFNIKAQIIQWAITYKHVYKRWQTVVNAMLEKIPGKPLLNKLRVIHLIESDLNITIGILWGRRLVRKGEQMEIFNDGQSGSRPDRGTQELLIQKHLTYSIWRMAQMNGASFDNDAKSCFDRIVMTLASLGSQQIGMTKRACELFLETLHQMKYHIKTGAGISDEYYTTSTDTTIHGPGQGGRGSPSVWLIVSSILMNCMEEKSDGTLLRSPFTEHEKILQRITGFVDDVTHWYSLTDKNGNIEDMIEDLTIAAQWWEQLLNSSGGKLELSKCFYYLIYWEYNDEGIPAMRHIRNDQYKVTIKDSETNETFTIDSKSCDLSHKTLGVMECPNGNYKDEYSRLMKKSQSFAQRISQNNISRREAHVLYRTTYIPSMRYSMSIGTFNLEQTKKIQGITTQHFMANMGYNRCMPKAITYGPKELGGLGLQHLYSIQGSEKICTMIRLMRTKRQAGMIIKIQLQWAQRISGTYNSILMDTSTELPQLEDEKWIVTLRHYLQISGLQIWIQNFFHDEKQCKYDKYIMDCIDRNTTTLEDIRKINRCRLYMRTTTISDIVNATGKYITKEAYECDENGRIENNGRWPNQPKPGPKHITVWKSFMNSLCKSDRLEIEQPLGEWDTKIIRKTVSCSAGIDETGTAVIKRDSTWTTGEIIKRRRYYEIKNETPTDRCIDTSTMIPADIGIANQTLTRIRWRNKIASQNSSINNENSWQQHVNKIEQWEKDIIGETKFHASHDDIKEKLEDGLITITFVSDGGCMSTKGSFGWVMANGHQVLISSKGNVSGQPMSSHRAEGFGKLSWIVCINQIIKFSKIKVKCHIKSYCDNQTLINQTKIQKRLDRVSEALLPNFDVVKEIIKQQDILLTVINTYDYGEHVKGHQDRTKALDKLTIPEYLNVKADELATDALKSHLFEKPNDRDIKFPSCNTSLMRDGKIISSKERYTTMWTWAEYNLQDYYTKRLNINEQEIHWINWTGLRIARSKLPQHIQTFSNKYCIGWLATGSRMERCGMATSKCPFCNEDENEDHLLLCRKRRNENLETIDEFHRYLTEIGTVPEILYAIVQGIDKWLHDEMGYEVHSNEVEEIIEKQGKIGWRFIVRGFVAEAWGTYQEIQSRSNEKEIAGDIWSAKVSQWWIETMYEKWIKRNEEIHSPIDGPSRNELETLAQVRLLYDHEHDILEQDRNIFSMPIERRLELPWQTLSEWVSNTWPTVKICMNYCNEKLKEGQTDINTFIQRKKMKTRWKTQRTKTINREKIKKKQKQHTITDYFNMNSHGINGITCEEFQVRVEPNNMSGAAFLE
jgi:hypothetical protein